MALSFVPDAGASLKTSPVPEPMKVGRAQLQGGQPALLKNPVHNKGALAFAAGSAAAALAMSQGQRSKKRASKTSRRARDWSAESTAVASAPVEVPPAPAAVPEATAPMDGDLTAQLAQVTGAFDQFTASASASLQNLSQSLPAVTLPSVELPALPAVELPALPALELPTFELPSSLPAVSLPALPALEVPQLQAPELPKLEEFQLPNFDSVTFPTSLEQLGPLLQQAAGVLEPMLPAAVIDVLRHPEVLAPLAEPVGAGLALLAFLALRRGPQPWLSELPQRYDPEWIEAYWSRRPLRLLTKFSVVLTKGGWFWLQMKLDQVTGKEEANMPERALQARELVTDLGVAFIKIAQVWASRPDVLPEAYNKEFEKLLERVRPFGKDEAFRTLGRNLSDMENLFDDMKAFEEPIASASVGQVYKASVDGRSVAVKVQRPDVREQVTIDIFVIRSLCKIGAMLPEPRLAGQCKSSLELIGFTAPTWFEELNYQAEASNQKKFAETVQTCDLIKDTVVVPEVLLATPEVLVQEWLDGKKLTEPGVAKENANKVVNLLLNSYMVQFLETGYLHGDPHPGNFVLMPSGKLGILDYGLMTNIQAEKRVAFIEYLMHLQAKEYSKCLQDLINLEFIPSGIGDDKEAREVLVPALAQTLSTLYEEGGDMRKKSEIMMKQREEMKASGKLDQLRSQLQEISKRYGTFRLPSYFTLILRAFSTLEGLGLRVDGDFNIVQECFPYIARRLLTDDSFRIREALKSYLYMGRRRVAAKRIDDLATGFSTFTNLMKGSKSEYIGAAGDGSLPKAATATVTVEAPAEPAAAKPPIQLDNAVKDIAGVVFSPQGNFLQDILIEEGIAAVDALSRAALVQLLQRVGPLALPFTVPLGFLLGADDTRDLILAREDKEALLLLRRIVSLIQAPAAERPEQPEPVSNQPLAQRSGNDLLRAAEDLRRLQPLARGLLPTVAPGAAAFAQRFAQQLARRVLLRFAEDIERSAGLGTNFAAAAAA